MVGNLLSDVERFARWVFPGALLLTLIHLGSAGGLPSAFLLGTSGVIQVFGLTVGIIVSASILYMVHRNLFHSLLQLCLFNLGLSDVSKYAELKGGCKSEKSSLSYLKWRNQFNRVVAFKAAQEPVFGSYKRDRDFYWGITHGIAITWELLGLSLCLIEPKSFIGMIPHWRLGMIGLFLAVLLAWILLIAMHMVAGRDMAELVKNE